MATITDFASLKSVCEDTLNRADLTSYMDDFVQEAEDKIKGDDRLRKLQYRATFNATADGDALPTDYQRLESLVHDGPTYHFPIKSVGHAELTVQKARLGQTTGVPRYVAIVDGAAYWAPVPDNTYGLKMVYVREIVPLSDSVTTNWVLEEWPNLYKYGVLAAANRFLKYDERAQYFDQLFENLAEKIHLASWNEQFSGTLHRNFEPIG